MAKKIVKNAYSQDQGIEYNYCVPGEEEEEEEEESLVCVDLTRSPTVTLNIGDTVAFTCTGSSENVDINHYEFRLSSNGGTNYTVIDNNNTTGTTSPYTITSDGNYVVQCRVCSSSDSSHCTTPWGAAGGWSP